MHCIIEDPGDKIHWAGACTLDNIELLKYADVVKSYMKRRQVNKF